MNIFKKKLILLLVSISLTFIFLLVKQQQNNTTMNEITINIATLESEMFLYKHESAIEWTLNIYASDKKKYIYVGDDTEFPTYNSVKDYFLNQVHSDLGEKAYFQLLEKINLL